MTTDQPKPRRRFFRYSLRTLLLVMTVSSIWIGVLASRARHQRDTILAIEALGGRVQFQHQLGRRNATPPGPEWLRNLIGEDYFRTVRSIVLPGKSATDALLRDISAFTELESLRVPGNPITDEGLAHLAGLTKLKGLSIGGSGITDAGLVHLSDMQDLIALSLAGTAVTDGGLLRLKKFNNLYTLDLAFTQVTDSGMEILADIPSLSSLDLSHTDVSDAGIRHLAKLPNVWRLCLEEMHREKQNRITDAAFDDIATMKNLQILRVVGFGFTDAGLARLHHLSKLQSIHISNLYPQFTEEGVARLRKALPKAKIIDVWARQRKEREARDRR